MLTNNFALKQQRNTSPEAIKNNTTPCYTSSNVNFAVNTKKRRVEDFHCQLTL